METTTYLKGKSILVNEEFIPATIEIRGGKIIEVHREAVNLRYVYPSQVIDAGENLVMPGLVDTHTHIDEPGRTQWEGFWTATRAAAAGGFTTLVDMPLQCNPPTTTEENLDLKLYCAQGKCHVDVGFWGGVLPGNHTDMVHLLERGVCGFKCFMINCGLPEFPNVLEDDISDALAVIKKTGSVLMLHAEVPAPPEFQNLPVPRPECYKPFLATLPPAMEYKAIEIVSRVCKKQRYGRCHIVHLCATEALPLIRDLKDGGYPITVETCPHYLNWCEDDIGDGWTEYLCLPPIRSAENREALWDALRDGTIDMIAADHANCTPMDWKPRDFKNSWGGIAGLQFGLQAVWTNGKRRGFLPVDIWRWMSLNPSKLAKLDDRKGHIKPGYDADFVIWDPNDEYVIEKKDIHYKNKMTPYFGKKFLGRIKQTILAGQIVYDGEIFAKPSGKFLFNKWDNLNDLHFPTRIIRVPQVIGGGWQSRRSPVYSTHGMVACTQPLAAQIGLNILKNGGNAADAAVGIAAALNLLQPNSTGIGGDVACLFYNAADKKAYGLNATGRCPSGVTISSFNELGFTEQNRPDPYHPLFVTVPGAALGWIDTYKLFGNHRLSLSEILEEVIDLAENGYPVGLVTAQAWQMAEQRLVKHKAAELLWQGARAPMATEIMTNKGLARTFRLLAEKGKAGFYEGEVAQAIVDSVNAHGGCICLHDLRQHENTYPAPIESTYNGYNLYEMPPNCQGIAGLLALNLLEGFDIKNMEHNSPAHLHLVIEALRVAFADSRYYIADPEHDPQPFQALLSKDYAKERRRYIKRDTANTTNILRGYPDESSNTVYFCVVDNEGNACSFMNSNYLDFGSHIVAKGYGFVLSNHGANFSLDSSHPNRLEPNKRPYSTTMPGIAVYSDTKAIKGTAPDMIVYGVMGGLNQPQGSVQVLSNMIDFGMNAQEALDAPRVQISGATGRIDGHSTHGQILLEDFISEDTRRKLEFMGHKNPKLITRWERQTFGSGQIINTQINQTYDAEENVHLERVLIGGSDPRNDGMALGY